MSNEKTLTEIYGEIEDAFDRAVDTRNEFGEGSYMPFDTLRNATYFALKSHCDYSDDDMELPAICSITLAIAESSARDAVEMKSKSPVGFAIAIAQFRSSLVAKRIRKAKNYDEVKNVRDEVLTENKFPVVR